MSESFLDYIATPWQVEDAFKDIEKFDEQSATLFVESWTKLSQAAEMTSSQRDALSRLVEVIKKRSSMQKDLLRNNVFKAANSLGIKLPSYSFAASRKDGSAVMKDKELRSKLVKIAERYSETRQHIIPILKQAAIVDAEHLPKPSPWVVPVPWDVAKEQVADNINAFVAAGCSVRKIRPVADPYVLFLYRGWPFTLQVGRKMITTTGNLWADPEDVTVVTSQLSALFSKVKRFLAGSRKTVSMDKILLMVKPLTRNRWSTLLAAGIVSSALELNGVMVWIDQEEPDLEETP